MFDFETKIDCGLSVRAREQVRVRVRVCVEKVLQKRIVC